MFFWRKLGIELSALKENGILRRLGFGENGVFGWLVFRENGIFVTGDSRKIG